MPRITTYYSELNLTTPHVLSRLLQYAFDIFKRKIDNAGEKTPNVIRQRFLSSRTEKLVTNKRKAQSSSADHNHLDNFLLCV